MIIAAIREMEEKKKVQPNNLLTEQLFTSLTFISLFFLEASLSPIEDMCQGLF